MALAGKKKKIFDGRYEVLSIVGRGSASVVYHARNVSVANSEVALKVLINQSRRVPVGDRLRKEALAMVSSRHRYVVRLDDFHSVGELCYLSMEYAPEADLRKYIVKSGGTLGAASAQRFMSQVAEALDFVHAVGILHRDIKPDNILVINKDEIRLGDFGVALLPGDDSKVEDLRTGVGTMNYMAPEVLDGTGYDRRSDIYALGVTFYEALSGVHPFEKASLIKQLEARHDESIPHINTLVSDLPEAFADAIMKCMRFKPEDRFASARDLWQAITIEAPASVSAQTAASFIQPAEVIMRDSEESDTAEAQDDATAPLADQDAPAKKRRRRRKKKKSAKKELADAIADILGPDPAAAPGVAQAGAETSAKPAPKTQPPAWLLDDDFEDDFLDDEPFEEEAKPSVLKAEETVHDILRKDIALGGEPSKKPAAEPASGAAAVGTGKIVQHPAWMANEKNAAERSGGDVAGNAAKDLQTDFEDDLDLLDDDEDFLAELDELDDFNDDELLALDDEDNAAATTNKDQDERKAIVRESGERGTKDSLLRPKIEKKKTASLSNKSRTLLTEEGDDDYAGPPPYQETKSSNWSFGMMVAAALLAVGAWKYFSAPSASIPSRQETAEVQEPAAPNREPGANSGELEQHLGSAHAANIPQQSPRLAGARFPSLPGGIYSGTIVGLYPDRRVTVSLISLPDAMTLAVVLGIDGWSPVTVSVQSFAGLDTTERPLRIASNGIVLDLKADVVQGELVGTIVNAITGDQGEWKAQPVE